MQLLNYNTLQIKTHIHNMKNFGMTPLLARFKNILVDDPSGAWTWKVNINTCLKTHIKTTALYWPLVGHVFV